MKTFFRVLLLILPFSAFAGELDRGVMPDDSCSTIKSRESSLGFILLGEDATDEKPGHKILAFGDPANQAKRVALYKCDGDRWDYSYTEIIPSLNMAFSTFEQRKLELISKYGPPSAVSRHMRPHQPIWLRARAMALGESDMLDVYTWHTDNIVMHLAFSWDYGTTKLLSSGWSIHFDIYRQEAVK